MASNFHLSNAQNKNGAMVQIKIEPGLDWMNFEHDAVSVKVEDGFSVHAQLLVEHSYARQPFNSSEEKPVIQVLTSCNDDAPQVAIQPKIENCDTPEPQTSLTRHSRSAATLDDNQDSSVLRQNNANAPPPTEPDISIVKEETADDFAETNSSEGSTFPTIDDDTVLSDCDTEDQPLPIRQTTAEDSNFDQISSDVESVVSTGNDFLVAKSEPVEIKEEFPETYNTRSSTMLVTEINRREDSYYLNLHKIRQCKVLLERLKPLSQIPWKDGSNGTSRGASASKRGRKQMTSRRKQNVANHALKSENSVVIRRNSRNSSTPNNHSPVKQSKSTRRSTVRTKHEVSVSKRSRHNTEDRTGKNGDLYQCDICKLRFTLKKILRCHVLTHIREKSANKSDKTNLTSKVMKVKTESKAKDFKCLVCKKELNSKRSLEYHDLIHSGVRPYECNVCHRRFHIKSHLDSHSRVHEDSPIQCHICHKYYKSINSLRTHTYMHTRISGHKSEGRFQCQKCPKSYSQAGDLRRHQSTHSGVMPFSCSECNKGFIKRYDLNRHLATHKGLKPHKCQICQKGFSRKEHLAGHMGTHSTSMPYRCDICLNRYSVKSTLRVHMRRHLEAKSLKCQFCEKVFGYMDNLRSHLRIHQKKNFLCGKCMRWFTEKRDLRNHVMGHFGVKSFCCDVCNAKFVRKSYLKQHIQNHR